LFRAANKILPLSPLACTFLGIPLYCKIEKTSNDIQNIACEASGIKTRTGLSK
jgi:hypothetical protein